MTAEKFCGEIVPCMHFDTKQFQCTKIAFTVYLQCQAHVLKHECCSRCLRCRLSYISTGGKVLRYHCLNPFVC